MTEDRSRRRSTVRRRMVARLPRVALSAGLFYVVMVGIIAAKGHPVGTALLAAVVIEAGFTLFIAIVVAVILAPALIFRRR